MVPECPPTGQWDPLTAAVAGVTVGAAAEAVVRWASVRRPAEPVSWASVIAGLGAGIGTWMLLRAMPELGDEALEESEHRILASLHQPWRHEWTIFDTEHGGRWALHSIFVHGSYSDDTGGSGGGMAPSPEMDSALQPSPTPSSSPTPLVDGDAATAFAAPVPAPPVAASRSWPSGADSRQSLDEAGVPLRSVSPTGSGPGSRCPTPLSSTGSVVGAAHVVILHGHSGGCAHWSVVADAVATSAQGVHILDMPGWGRSPTPDALRELAARRMPGRVPARPAAAKEEGGEEKEDGVAGAAAGADGGASPASATAGMHSSASQRRSALHEAAITIHLEMLVAWLDARGLTEPVILVGHSMGAMMATHFAEWAPHRVRQLVLADVAGVVPAISDTVAWTLMMRYFAPQRISRWTGRLGYVIFRAAYLAATVEDERYPDYYYQLAYGTTVRGCADNLWNTLVEHSDRFQRVQWLRPVLDLLVAAPQPMSIIWGEHDEMFPVSHARLIHRLRPDTDLYIVRGALHNPAHNNGPAFAAAVLDAIWRVEGRARPLVQRAAPIPTDTPSRAIAVEDTPGAWLAGSLDEKLTHVHAVEVTEAVDSAARRLLTQPPSEDEVRGAAEAAGVDADELLTALHEWSEDGWTTSGSVMSLGEGGVAPPPALVSRDSSAGAGAAGGAGADDHHSFEFSTSTGSRRYQPHVHAAPMEALGRGVCHSCGGRVLLRNAHWQCLCARWTFSAHRDSGQHSKAQSDMTRFLEDLYVHGSFAAREAGYLHHVQFLRAPAAVDAASPASGAHAPGTPVRRRGGKPFLLLPAHAWGRTFELG